MIAEAAVQSIISWLFVIWFVGTIAGVVYWFWDTDAYRHRFGFLGPIWSSSFVLIRIVEGVLKGDLFSIALLSAFSIVALVVLILRIHKATNRSQPA